VIIQARNQKAVAVLTISGSAFDLRHATQISRALEKAIEQGYTRLVLDMSQVAFFSDLVFEVILRVQDRAELELVTGKGSVVGWHLKQTRCPYEGVRVFETTWEAIASFAQ